MVDIAAQLRDIEPDRPDVLGLPGANVKLGLRQPRHHRSQLILKRRDQNSRLGGIRIGHAHDGDMR